MGLFHDARALLGGVASGVRDLLRPTAATTPLPLVLQSIPTHGGLTPVRLSAAIALADTGYPYDLVDLANNFRQKDGHLQSVLGTREMGVAKLGWQVKPTDESKEAAAIAAFVEEALKGMGANALAGEEQIPVKDFRTLIAHLTSSVFFGYAVAEVIWEKKDFPLDPGNPKSRMAPRLVPAGSVHVAHRRFVFNQATGRIHWFDVNAYVPGQPAQGLDLSQQTQGKFIVAQPRVNGDIAAREGLSRVLSWMALFRNFTLKDWMELAQLAWKPWRIGYYDKQAGRDDIAALDLAIQKLTSQGVALLPKLTELRVEWPKATGGRATGQHQGLNDWLAKEMSKATLGQTMTADAGSSRSQAEVHNEVRGEIREADATFLAAVIIQQLITPLIRMNFGPDVPVPGFSFVFDKTEDIVAVSSAVVNLVKSGVELVAAEVRQRCGFRDPKPGEVVVGGACTADPAHEPVAPPPKQPPPDPNKPEPDTDEDDEEDEDDAPGSTPPPVNGDEGSRPPASAPPTPKPSSGSPKKGRR